MIIPFTLGGRHLLYKMGSYFPSLSELEVCFITKYFGRDSKIPLWKRVKGSMPVYKEFLNL